MKYNLEKGTYKHNITGKIVELINIGSYTVTYTEPNKQQEIYDSITSFSEKHSPLFATDAPQAAPTHDPVNSPTHYTAGGIETIDFIEAKGFGYNLGNAIKYISRAGRKDDTLQDLKKARWYIDREIYKLEQGQT